MLEREPLISLIRFQLEQLGPKNRHHEFERIAFHVARARIARNLLPSTGPVSGGGDQGRDAETFLTYYRVQRLEDAADAADVVVLLCTTKSKGLPAKIKSDIRKAVLGKPQPNRIYAFLTADLPVSVRHSLKDWAQSTHNVTLEIIDGQAVSCYLADWDLAWVAHDYLNISTKLLSPSLPDLNACRIAAHAAVPTHPDLEKQITFRADGKIAIEMNIRSDAEPLQFSLSFRDSGVAERVERATRYGEVVELISNDKLREFEIQPDSRVAGFFHDMSAEGQHLVITSEPGVEIPVQIVSEEDSLNIPYATIQHHGTNRAVLQSPHLAARLTLDCEGPTQLRVHAALRRASSTVFWRTLMFLKAIQEGDSLQLRWLTDESRTCSLDFLRGLASELASRGLFSEAHIRLRELMMIVEKGSGVQLPSDMMLSSEDIGLLERLRTFYSTGRAEFEAQISYTIKSEVELDIADENTVTFGGHKMCISIAEVEIPMSEATGLILTPKITVGGRRVRRIKPGQLVRITSIRGFVLQRQ